MLHTSDLITEDTIAAGVGERCVGEHTDMTLWERKVQVKVVASSACIGNKADGIVHQSPESISRDHTTGNSLGQVLVINGRLNDCRVVIHKANTVALWMC